MSGSKPVIDEPIVNREIPIGQLHAHPQNYRGHPATQIERLRASLRAFGQPRSIVAQDAGDGALHHRGGAWGEAGGGGGRLGDAALRRAATSVAGGAGEGVPGRRQSAWRGWRRMTRRSWRA